MSAGLGFGEDSAQPATGAKRVSQEYDRETVVGADVVPPDMPFKYPWRTAEKLLYPLSPRSQIARIYDPQAPAWVNNFFRLRKLYGELVYLYMDIWDFEKSPSIPTPMGPAIKPGSAQNAWQASGWVDYCLLTGDAKVSERINRLAGMMHRIWTIDTQHFKAGYWMKADIDHGSEDLAFTTARWWMLRPGDPVFAFSAETFARLAGNWGPADVPHWYDWQRHRWKA